MNSALFVDFDNIHIHLRGVFPEAADAFAKSPSAWLGRLAGPDGARRLLMRNVYLNPSRYAGVRDDFLRAGFRVVECPSLTHHGKSSADAYLLLDAVDALAHPGNYGEFVFMSADSDFAPLLRRVREHARRVVVASPGPASLAYVALADEVVDANALFGIQPPAGTSGADGLLDAMAQVMVDWIKAAGDLSVRDLPQLLRRFPEFTRESNWLGFRSARRLAEAIAARDPSLRIVGSDRADWVVTVGVLEGDAPLRMVRE